MSEQQQKKRGRGRPRKILTEEEIKARQEREAERQRLREERERKHKEKPKLPRKPVGRPCRDTSSMSDEEKEVFERKQEYQRRAYQKRKERGYALSRVGRPWVYTKEQKLQKLANEMKRILES